MKISEILNESAYDAIAHYHAIPDAKHDQNPEANAIAEKNAERYRLFFREFYETGVAPVFTHGSEDEASKMTNVPENEEYSSAGHRGMKWLRDRGRIGK